MSEQLRTDGNIQSYKTDWTDLIYVPQNRAPLSGANFAGLLTTLNNFKSPVFPEKLQLIMIRSLCKIHTCTRVHVSGRKAKEVEKGEGEKRVIARTNIGGSPTSPRHPSSQRVLFVFLI